MDKSDEFFQLFQLVSPAYEDFYCSESLDALDHCNQSELVKTMLCDFGTAYEENNAEEACRVFYNHFDDCDGEFIKTCPAWKPLAALLEVVSLKP